ncbi:MAG: hypothetical protein A3F31_02200 [Candidatus Levybacteria bacterium RIFCSPHIGHO2_12_FULL_38_12]|nr:MAG: hypothetical protein A2770_03120 [Candidatus Levybacteria bacterium RIFCSPHIGHO2_01_FULL_38_12]OGH22796.1 MAG: hypothetical protein A3F31_02200 [Candidatus Levybacteria bacterium RIFCSPHIGHO2_12_FULL_38_12]OGH33983.1 MAG: hypothetical protein A3A47_00305 [Candidatus Levybacteria bacterium RIFCSPLOWO2_01_FULL_37_20]OGH44805.1 MAG: hypothetical protein A3J14_04655 [Candidatus Levybacteria bacterium RIFCSPLOWO2_02_FULL_37_18]OGH51035.1 MAG: hypothetical protein A3G13_03090 [Candidatus Levy
MLFRLSNIANWLQEKFYADQGTYSKEKQSDIVTTDEQKQFMATVLAILDTWRTCNSAFVEAGIQKAKAIFSDPSRIAKLVNKAKDASPQSNKQSETATLDLIEAISTEQPGIAAKELRKAIQRRTGRLYSAVRIATLGKHLRESSRNVSAVKKTAYHYFPQSSEEN